ncbi:MAG: hypothetical protein KAJ66_02860 [Candidatus Omnitrophica bacterium]|nr:hypothetical protein [Candidatus Omnitrophota bacterium]
MNKEELKEKLKNAASGLLKARGLELVEIELGSRKQKGLVVLFLLDKPGGITLEECAEFNRRMGEVLEESEIVPGRFVLEAASPGLDRPLVTKRDFERVRGEVVEVTYAACGTTIEETCGKIVEIEGDNILLDIAGERKELSLSRIKKAVIKLDMKRKQ